MFFQPRLSLSCTYTIFFCHRNHISFFTSFLRINRTLFISKGCGKNKSRLLLRVNRLNTSSICQISILLWLLLLLHLIFYFPFNDWASRKKVLHFNAKNSSTAFVIVVSNQYIPVTYSVLVPYDPLLQIVVRKS